MKYWYGRVARMKDVLQNGNGKTDYTFTLLGEPKWRI